MNNKKKKQIDDFDVEVNEALSPEVRKRLEKLQELNDANNVSDEDFTVETPTSTKKQMRTMNKNSVALVQSKEKKRSKGSKMTEQSYNVEIVLEKWNEDTDYGKTFRALTSEEQAAEVKRLNVGTSKGVKEVIKKKLLDANFKEVVAEKMKSYLCESRMRLMSMIHEQSTNTNVVLLNPSFISVGEWVEVDADRTPGYNSEGGVAVVIAVADALVDVK